MLTNPDPNYFRIDFTDVTINEADGSFEEVSNIMSVESPNSKEWVLRSSASILTSYGMGIIDLQFHSDGNIYILDFKASVGDVFYNPDIPAISQWAQDNGWKIPQPQPNLAKSNKEFWKHFYDTLIIDSDYFDKRYGVRPQLQSVDKKNNKKKNRRS